MKQKKCIVIDYGLGNTFSVMSVIRKIGHNPELSSDPKTIMGADRVILPGVGAFGQASQKLKKNNLDKVIIEYAATEKPLLGICVGMQLLMEQGEEFGSYQGLGLIPGLVQKIKFHKKSFKKVRVPIIGWFPIVYSFDRNLTNKPSNDININNVFYFVHSYEVKTTNETHKIASYSLREKTITSIVRKDNVLGVQFHPERSGESGQRFFKNFIEK